MTANWRNVSALALCAAAAPSLVHAQQLGGGSDFELPLVRLTVGLIFCTLVAVIAALALRRVMRGGTLTPSGSRFAFLRAPARKMHVLESQRLSAHADVCILTCDDREYLVVVSAGGATVLREQTRADEPLP